MDEFRLEATRLYWLNDDGRDDPSDMCLHGHVIAHLGDTVIESDCTVSAAAMRLLKTLEEDHLYRGNDEQMLPCCGHFLVASDDLQTVTYIGGCFDGADWSVLHENGAIRIVLADGREFSLDPDEYRAEVFRFADRIQAHYESCLPKILPDDEPERSGWIAFRNEWHHRRHPQ